MYIKPDTLEYIDAYVGEVKKGTQASHFAQDTLHDAVFINQVGGKVNPFAVQEMIDAAALSAFEAGRQSVLQELKPEQR
jgi:hypothetical protein